MDKNIILFGGEKCLAEHLDGSSEEVSVRILSVKSFPALMESLEDECAMAEVFCDKPKGWGESLTLPSLEAIVVKGETLNDDFFSRWARRRLARQERLIPGITERRLASASRTGSAR
jgi:hypothetical protein